MQEGYVSVTVTDQYSCIGSVTAYVKNMVSVRELGDLARIEISPNPAFDILTLDMVGLDGKVITNRTLSGYNHYDEFIDVKRFAKGIYIIRVYNRDWILSDKIIIQ